MLHILGVVVCCTYWGGCSVLHILGGGCSVLHILGGGGGGGVVVVCCIYLLCYICIVRYDLYVSGRARSMYSQV